MNRRPYVLTLIDRLDTFDDASVSVWALILRRSSSWVRYVEPSGDIRSVAFDLGGVSVVANYADNTLYLEGEGMAHRCALPDYFAELVADEAADPIHVDVAEVDTY